MNDLNNWENIFCHKPTPIQKLEDFCNVEIYVKRDDLNHPIIQGNKLRKLKYNLRSALELNKSCVATFGGAWSNHILATAKACSLCNMDSIGFIRGDELNNAPELWSTTLNQAKEFGMEFNFLSRKEYRFKQSSNQVNEYIKKRNNDVVFLPEGGSNSLALLGVAEIIYELQNQINPPTHIITACGTGGTMAGLIEGVYQAKLETKILGIPVLKNAVFLQNEIKNHLSKNNQVKWQIFDEYHFGGYAKNNQELTKFGVDFVKNTKIDLDKVYTSKTFYAAYDLIRKKFIPENSRVLILHTGGLQGGSITNV